MNYLELFQTIYLGDRACKKIVADGRNNRLGIQIDSISMLREGTEIWDINDDENVHDGWLVFGEVSEIKIVSLSGLPNDYVHNWQAEQVGDEYLFTFAIGSVNDRAEHSSADIVIKSKTFSIESNKEFLNQLISDG